MLPVINTGVPKEHYIADATDNGAGNDKWTSTTVQSYTVPTGFVWYLYGGHVNRDTSTGTATLVIDVYNDSDELVMRLDSQADASGITGYPNSTYVSGLRFPIFLEADWYVKITIGEAQGGSATASCFVIECPAIP